MSKKWQPELVIKFLEVYEQHPCLWNHKLPSYKDRNKRDDALKTIVEVMREDFPEFNANTAKAKIRSVRNAYTLEKHKVWKSRKSGMSTDEIYKPTVPWFSTADRFLDGVVEAKETQNTLESQKSTQQDVLEESEEILRDDVDNEDNYSNDIVQSTSLLQSPLPTTLKQPSQSFGVKRQRPSNLSKKQNFSGRNSKIGKLQVVSQAVATLNEIANRSAAPQPQLDEHELFGKTVAAHLRQLPQNTALECQSEILKYLVQKRLGKSACFSGQIQTSSPFVDDSTTYTSPLSNCSTEAPYHVVGVTNNELPNYDWPGSTTDCTTSNVILQAWRDSDK